MSNKSSDKYQKAQYVQKLILTGIGTSGKINFQGDPKARTWKITIKQADGNWIEANEAQVRNYLQTQEINIDYRLSNEKIPFTTYKMEDGTTVIDKVYPTYTDFLKDNIKTKGTSATKLQDNYYIEVGDVDNTLSGKIEEAKNEPKGEIITTSNSDGVNFVFQQTPELSKIGSKEQYEEYLKTIFPNSKVKDIVYHSRFTVYNIKNKSRWKNGFYSGTKDQADLMAEMAEDSNSLMTTSALLINLQNPKVTTYSDRKIEDYKDTNDGFIIRATKEDALQLIGNRDGYNVDNFKEEYVVFEPEQIYILGNEQDIQNFKKFVGGQKTKLINKISDDIIQTSKLKYKTVELKGKIEDIKETQNGYEVTLRFKTFNGSRLEKVVIENGNVIKTISNSPLKIGETIESVKSSYNFKFENEEITENPSIDKFKDILDMEEKDIKETPEDEEFKGLLRSRSLVNKVTPEQAKAAKEWFDNSPISKHITLRQFQNIVNSDAYATWLPSAITLWKGSEYTDLIHESWHEFSQLYLTKAQKEVLYNEIKESNPKYKDYSLKQIEELIAEDFRNYVLSNQTLILNSRPKRNSIFRKIYNFLKELITGNVDLQTYYERLYTGNISKYKRDLNNAFWGNLNSGITTKDGKTLSATDTKNLYRAIDSLVGIIFAQNQKPPTMMFADNNVLNVVYSAIFKKFNVERNKLLVSVKERISKINSLTPTEREQLSADSQTIRNLTTVLTDWNNVLPT